MKNSKVPDWFSVGANVQFGDFGPIYKVVFIQDQKWEASCYGDKCLFPLDEVAKYWKLSNILACLTQGWYSIKVITPLW